MNRDYHSLSTGTVLEPGVTVITHYPITGPESFELKVDNMSNKSQEEIIAQLLTLTQHVSELQRGLYRAISAIEGGVGTGALKAWAAAGLTRQTNVADNAAGAVASVRRAVAADEKRMLEAIALLTRASHHLKEHRSDYDHPGQTGLIEEIDNFVAPPAKTSELATPEARAAFAVAEAASQTQKAVFIPQFSIAELDEKVQTSLNKKASPTGEVDTAAAAAGTGLGSTIVKDALENAKTVLREALKEAGIPEHLLDVVKQVSAEDLYKVSRATAGPTEVDVETPGPTPVVEESPVLSAFIGAGSIFIQHLSTNVIFNGQGDLEPKVGDLKRWAEDAMWIAEPVLRKWPSGFYLNRDTKVMQFLVNTDQYAIVVDGLPSEVAPVHVLVYGDKSGFRKLQEFKVSEQKLLHAKLEDALKALVKKNQ